MANFKALLSTYKTQKKKKPKLEDWSDSNLLKMRDKFRKLARKTRGDWTLEFYETLQDLNKIGAKKKLPPQTV